MPCSGSGVNAQLNPGRHRRPAVPLTPAQKCPQPKAVDDPLVSANYKLSSWKSWHPSSWAGLSFGPF